MQGPAAMETGFQSSLLPGLHTEGGREREIRERKQKRPKGRRNSPCTPFGYRAPSQLISLLSPWAGWGSRLDSFFTISALLISNHPSPSRHPQRCQAPCAEPSAEHRSFLWPLHSLLCIPGWENYYFFFLSPVRPTILTPSEAQEALADDAVP